MAYNLPKIGISILYFNVIPPSHNTVSMSDGDRPFRLIIVSMVMCCVSPLKK